MENFGSCIRCSLTTRHVVFEAIFYLVFSSMSTTHSGCTWSYMTDMHPHESKFCVLHFLFFANVCFFRSLMLIHFDRQYCVIVICNPVKSHTRSKNKQWGVLLNICQFPVVWEIGEPSFGLLCWPTVHLIL